MDFVAVVGSKGGRGVVLTTYPIEREG